MHFSKMTPLLIEQQRSRFLSIIPANSAIRHDRTEVNAGYLSVIPITLVLTLVDVLHVPLHPGHCC